MGEAVNHPQHYQKEGRKECIKEMEEQFGIYETCIFALLSAYKYIYRAGEKAGNSKQQDIEKAKWYLAYAKMANRHNIRPLELYYYLIKEELANVES